jgi:Kef-type K+ transport system membrane component KefB
MNHLLQFLLLLAVIVTVAKLAGSAANRIGLPAVFGEILAGLLLGPTLLNILGWQMFLPGHEPEHGGPAPSLMGVVRDIAEVGVVLLMFIAGMETDVKEMRRVGGVALWAALGGVLVPFAGGAATAAWFGLPLFWEGLFIGTILTATSVSISAQTLMELGALRSKEGSTILGAAVIDDVMGIIVLSVVVAFSHAENGVSAWLLASIVLRMAGYFAAAILVGRYLFTPLARWADRLGVSQGLIAIVLAVAFFYGWAAEMVGGVAAITGSYLAGVMFAQTPYKTRIDEGIHPLTYSMLVPVFFMSIGLQANGRELGDQIGLTVTLSIVAIVAKLIGAGAFARGAGFTTRESLRVGTGMISRGEVGLIVAGYGLANGLIGDEVFAAAVIMVLATTMVTPPLLKLTFPRGGKPVHRIVEETVAGPPEETADIEERRGARPCRPRGGRPAQLTSTGATQSVSGSARSGSHHSKGGPDAPMNSTGDNAVGSNSRARVPSTMAAISSRTRWNAGASNSRK